MFNQYNTYTHTHTIRCSQRVYAFWSKDGQLMALLSSTRHGIYNKFLLLLFLLFLPYTVLTPFAKFFMQMCAAHRFVQQPNAQQPPNKPSAKMARMKPNWMNDETIPRDDSILYTGFQLCWRSLLLVLASKKSTPSGKRICCCWTIGFSRCDLPFYPSRRPLY